MISKRIHLTPFYHLKVSSFQYIFFAVFLFCSYIQFPFTGFASLIVPSFFCFLLFNIAELLSFDKKTFLIIAVYGVYIGFTVLISAFTNSELSRTIRFLLILLMLPFTFLYKSYDRQKQLYLYNIFMVITYVKVLSLIVIYIVYLQILDYAPFRIYAVAHSGDIYSLGSKYLLRIQVPGNALVMGAFLINLLFNGKIKKSTIFLFIGVLLCGNFAFLMGAFIMFFYVVLKGFLKKKKNINKMPLYIFILMLMIVLIYPYYSKTMMQKSSGSNKIRNEQIPYLLSGDVVFGNGMGHIVDGKTKRRDYSKMDYFEYQSLYIIHQIGFIGYFAIIFSTIYFVYKRTNRKEYIICYLIYLLYAFFNPYCFDTTHMLFGLLLSIDKENVVHEK